MSAAPKALQWLAVDLLSGRIICEVPGITSADATRRTLGQYESLSVKVAISGDTSPSWRSGTDPFRSGLIAVRGQPGAEVIYWGGVVLRRTRDLGSNIVTLTLATPECYLASRFTGAYTTDPSGVGAKTSQNTVVADLVNQFCVASQGLPIAVQTVTDGNPVPTVLAIYNDYDDKTVYSNLVALMGAIGGPEWTAHWTWDRATNLIAPVLYVGNRIGTPSTTGLAPGVTFDRANLISATLDENYSSGMGANDITATSSGQGLARPQARSPNPPLTALNGRPRVQYRFQPATSILDPLTLQQHADRANKLLANGTNTITLKASATDGPQLGPDWNLGDDVGYVLDGPAFPGGLTGVGRCIGYEADDTYTSPVLYVPQVI